MSETIKLDDMVVCIDPYGPLVKYGVYKILDDAGLDVRVEGSSTAPGYWSKTRFVLVDDIPTLVQQLQVARKDAERWGQRVVALESRLAAIRAIADGHT